MQMKQLFYVTVLWLAIGCAALSGRAQTNFATLASDGGWCWFSDPRAVFHNGTLYFGYVRGADGYTVLSTFNPQTGATTNLWTSTLTAIDDHNVPGIQVRTDGTLLVLWARHGSDTFFSYRQSTRTNPVSPADWGPEQTTATVSGLTYCNPFQLTNEGGKIYEFSRDLNYNPTVFCSGDNGNTWSTPTNMIKTGTGSTRPYVKYCSDYKSRIDILYTDAHPDNYTNSLYHIYYLGGAFYKTDGNFLKGYANLPILHDSGERGSVVYQYSDAPSSDPNQWIQSARAWCWDVAYQTNGYPVCVFQVKASTAAGNRIYYYYARWTGATWQKRFIAQGGQPLYSGQPNYGAGIAIDPLDINTVYFSSDAANPLDLTSTTNVSLGAHYEIWKGVTTDGGLTFSWRAVTTNSTMDNCRPYVPRRFGGEPCVLWWRGTYTSYTSFNSSIVGLFTTPVPLPLPLPPITYVDATSGVAGNTTLANGDVFSPPVNGTTGADNNWEERTVYGSSGNIFEAGGETAEDAPELRTTINGLVPGANYSLYAFFWDAAGTTENWSIRVGFTVGSGTNQLFSAPDATGLLGAATAEMASTLTYTNTPTVFIENNRVLWAAPLGTRVADNHGAIEIFIDDKPSPIGANNRTWYDGVGYTLSPASYPTNLQAKVVGQELQLSWPLTHTGWWLQIQTNSLTKGLSDRWVNVPGSNITNSVTLQLNTAQASVFYRLAYP